jgi:hypothetical protein
MTAKSFMNGLFFVVFFTTGVAAVSLSVLAREIGTLYRDKALLQKLETSNKKLQSLDKQYAFQLDQIKKNPASLARLRVLNLGEEPQDPQTAYPPSKSDQLIQAARNIIQQSQKEVKKKDEPPLVPQWVIRTCQARSRIALFMAGAALIIVSMMFFSQAPDPANDQSPAP